MIVLKFMAWMVGPGKRDDKSNTPAARDKVVSCDSYEIEHFPEDRTARVEIYRGTSPVPVETVLMGPPKEVTDLSHYRKLYVMNEQGKTIDSYCPEERRG